MKKIIGFALLAVALNAQVVPWTNTGVVAPAISGFSYVFTDPVTGWVIVPNNGLSFGLNIYASDWWEFDPVAKVFHHVNSDGTTNGFIGCSPDLSSQPGNRHPYWQQTIDTIRNWFWISGGAAEPCDNGYQVSTSGTAVTVTNGFTFYSADVGQAVTINGSPFTITAIGSGANPLTATINTSAGSLTGAQLLFTTRNTPGPNEDLYHMTLNTSLPSDTWVQHTITTFPRSTVTAMMAMDNHSDVLFYYGGVVNANINSVYCYSSGGSPSTAQHQAGCSSANTYIDVIPFNGLVGVSGTAVTWISGDDFSTVRANDYIWFYPLFEQVASVTDSHHLVLTASAGTISSQAWYAMPDATNGAALVFDPATNNLILYGGNGHQVDNEVWTYNTVADVGGTNCANPNSCVGKWNRVVVSGPVPPTESLNQVAFSCLPSGGTCYFHQSSGTGSPADYSYNTTTATWTLLTTSSPGPTGVNYMAYSTNCSCLVAVDASGTMWVAPLAATPITTLTVQEALFPGDQTGTTFSSLGGIARTNEPFCQGVPLADSLGISNDQTLTMTGVTAGQFRTLGRWPSGNIKWVQVCGIVASITAGGTATVTLESGGGGNFGGSNILSGTSTITANTTAMSATIKAAGGFNGFDTVTVGSTPVVLTSSSATRGLVLLGPSTTGTYPDNVTCGSGSGQSPCTKVYSSANDSGSSCTKEINGPVFAQAYCVGNLTDSGGHVYMQYTMRIEFYQGKAGTRNVAVLRNADLATTGNFASAYKGMQSFELRLAPNISGTLNYSVASYSTDATSGCTTGVCLGTMGGSDSVYVYQGINQNLPSQDFQGPNCGSSCYSTFTSDFGGAIVKNASAISTSTSTGTTTTTPMGFADISNSSGVGVEIGIEQMSSRWPASLEFDGGGSDVRVGIFPSENGNMAAGPGNGTYQVYQPWPQWYITTIFTEFHATAPASIKNDFLGWQYFLVATAPVSYYNSTGVFRYPLPTAAEEDAFMVGAFNAVPFVPLFSQPQLSQYCYAGGTSNCFRDSNTLNSSGSEQMAMSRDYSWPNGGPGNQSEFRWGDDLMFLKRQHTGRYLNSKYFYLYQQSTVSWPHCDGATSTDSTVNNCTWRAQSSSILNTFGLPGPAPCESVLCNASAGSPIVSANRNSAFPDWFDTLHAHISGQIDHYFLSGDETLKEAMVSWKDYFLNNSTTQGGLFNGLGIPRATGIELVNTALYSDYLGSIGDTDASNVLAQGTTNYTNFVTPDPCFSSLPSGCTMPAYVTGPSAPPDPSGVNLYRGIIGSASGRGSEWCLNVTNNPQGGVTTNGTTVTWSNGNQFAIDGSWNGQGISINSVNYTIASVSSYTSLTLTTSAGVQSIPVTYNGLMGGVRIGQPFQHGIYQDGLYTFRRKKGPAWSNYLQSGDSEYGVSQWALGEGFNYNGTNAWFVGGSSTQANDTRYNGEPYVRVPDIAQTCGSSTTILPGTTSQFGSVIYDNGSLSGFPNVTNFPHFITQIQTNGALNASQLNQLYADMAWIAIEQGISSTSWGMYQPGAIAYYLAHPIGTELQDISFTAVSTGGSNYNITATVPAGTTALRLKYSPQIITNSGGFSTISPNAGDGLLGYDAWVTQAFSLNPSTYATWFGATDITPGSFSSGSQTFAVTATSGLTGPNFSLKAMAPTPPSGTQVYLRSGAPQSQLISAIAVGPPAVITTAAPHGLSTGCGTSITCYVVMAQVCDTSGVPSKVNGLREATYVSSTQYSISTLFPSVAPITAGGTITGCGGGQPWEAVVTPYTLQDGPLAYLDGLTGPNNRKLQLSTDNGLASTAGLVVSGCPGACVVTVTTTYPHGVLPTSAQGKQEYFSIWGTTSSTLNQANTGTKGTSYPVASATTNTFTSGVVAGLTNGDYTNNLACGSDGVTFDTINGTDNCVVVSQLAWRGSGGANNPYWTNVTTKVANLGVGGTGIFYRHPFDGGSYTSAENFWSDFSNVAVNFMVDRQNQNLLDATIYTLDRLEAGWGDVNFATVTDLDVGQGDSNQVSSAFNISFQLEAALPFMSPTEISNVLAKTYNNINDPLGTPASTSRTNMGNLNSNINTVVASGTAQSGGTSTTIKISASDSQADHYYETLIVGYLPTGATIWCSGQVTGYVASTKVATVAGGFTERANGYDACPSASTSGNPYKFLAVASISTWNGSPVGHILDDDHATAGSTTTFTAAADGNNIGSAVSCYLPATFQIAACTCNTSTRLCTRTSGTWSPAPTAGTPYAIYSIDPTSTITGIHTTFLTSAHPGDAIYVSNNAEANSSIPTEYGLVLSCADDTHCLTLNNVNQNGYKNYGGTPPMMVWSIPQFDPAIDTGWTWLAAGVIEDPASTPVLAPPDGGSLSGGLAGNGPIGWSDAQHCSVGLVMAPYDTRAVADAATYCSHGQDYQMTQMQLTDTGPGHDGIHYTYFEQQPGHRNMAAILAGSIPTYPSLDLTGPWQKGPDLFRIYGNLPDMAYNGTWSPVTIGSSPNYTNCGNFSASEGTASGGTIQFAPNSITAAYLRNWMDTQWPSGSACLGNFPWGSSYAPQNPSFLLHNQPIVGSSDFTVLPHQRLFQDSSQAACLTFGWPCPVNYRESLAVSRSGFWSSANSANGSRSDTHVTFGSRTFCGLCFANGGGIYDFWEAGHWQVYQTGDLVASDWGPDLGSGGANSGAFGGSGTDYTSIGMAVQFGGTGSNIQADNQTPITMWGSQNHGSWDSASGDQNSNYMFLCSDLSNGYTVAQNYNLGCMMEFKEAGKDHFLLHWTTVSTSSGTTIAEHLHLAQNGELRTNPTIQVPYDEGHTACPGTHGCTGLDLDRVLTSIESGTSDGLGTDPTPNFGMVTNFLSPTSSPIFVSWDCPGGVECTSDPSLSTYSGGNGHTNRITLCAGSSSCSGSATTLESLIVMKLMPNRTDVTMTTTSLATNANFFYVQGAGSTSPFVAVLPRGGTTHSTMPSFTSTHSGTAQYLLGGLTAGLYNVTVGGVAVSGSPFTVAAGSNMIEFDSTAGAVVVSSGASSGATATGKFTGVIK
jgi:hypothetical protein